MDRAGVGRVLCALLSDCAGGGSIAAVKPGE